MPQLDLVTFSLQVFWLGLGLFLFYSFIIGDSGIVDKVSKVLKARKKNLV